MGLNIFERKQKPLGKMDLKELRKAELMAENRRKTLEKKAIKLAKKKQETFDRGAKTTSAELRRTLAQQFDLTTTEELMIGRQLNIVSKEVMIVSRIRAVKQNSGVNAVVRPQDLRGIETAMDKDSAASSVYQEILDDALEASHLDEGELGLSEAGKDVLAAWDGLDMGTFESAEAAMAEADKQTRERMAATASE